MLVHIAVGLAVLVAAAWPFFSDDANGRHLALQCTTIEAFCILLAAAVWLRNRKHPIEDSVGITVGSALFLIGLLCSGLLLMPLSELFSASGAQKLFSLEFWSTVGTIFGVALVPLSLGFQFLRGRRK